jgi:hypothetical protein
VSLEETVAKMIAKEALEKVEVVISLLRDILEELRHREK